jgi:hypothetical protein
MEIIQLLRLLKKGSLLKNYYGRFVKVKSQKFLR